MNPVIDINRRTFLGRTSLGLGAVALSVLGAGRRVEQWPGVVQP